MSEDGDHRDREDEGRARPANARERGDAAAPPDPATTTRWQTIRDWIRQTAGASHEQRKPPEPEAKESKREP